MSSSESEVGHCVTIFFAAFFAAPIVPALAIKHTDGSSVRAVRRLILCHAMRILVAVSTWDKECARETDRVEGLTDSHR